MMGTVFADDHWESGWLFGSLAVVSMFIVASRAEAEVEEGRGRRLRTGGVLVVDVERGRRNETGGGRVVVVIEAIGAV